MPQTDPFSLRPYQIEGVTLLRAALGSGARAPLYVLPTGGGKTRVFAYIVHGAKAKGNRVFILAHREEICTQISIALSALNVPHGRISPRYTETNDSVQVAMIQTAVRRLAKLPQPDLIIFDEAHHCAAGSWQQLRAGWPNAPALGVTATPERLDGKGLSSVFDRLIVGPTMRTLIEDGFLAGFNYLAPPTNIDMSSVGTIAGEFNQAETAARVDRRAVTGDVIEHYRRHMNGRPAIAFTVTVAHAQHVAEQFVEAGFRAASIDGSMDAVQRRDLLASIGDGRLNVLTSCELISEGVDVPVVAGAILLRPTQSLAVHLQQIGRCLRPKPDGSPAVILDHVGNAGRHGLPDEPRAWSLQGRDKKKKAPATVTCDICYRVFSRATAKGDVQKEGCGPFEPNLLDAPDAADNGDDINPKCPILFPSGGGKSAPPVVSGDLEEMESPWEWLRPSGIDPALAKGDEFKALIAMADTPEKLRLVARARKYHPNWVKHILRARGISA